MENALDSVGFNSLLPWKVFKYHLVKTRGARFTLLYQRECSCSALCSALVMVHRQTVYYVQRGEGKNAWLSVQQSGRVHLSCAFKLCLCIVGWFRYGRALRRRGSAVTAARGLCRVGHLSEFHLSPSLSLCLILSLPLSIALSNSLSPPLYLSV